MIEIKNLHKTFFIDSNPLNDKVALVDVNLTINTGDFITVIGGNGSGKTTLLNMIAGIFPPTSGKILIDGADVTKLPEHQRAKYIARVFQDPLQGTVGDMSIEENLSLALRRGKIPSLRWGLKRHNRALFKKVLQKLNLGLENRMNYRVGLLSGGQRQALTLMMATLKKPKILLLDEHTAALDPKIAKTVMDLSQSIIGEDHLTALMITHNMKDAIKYGNRLIMMSEGRIILDIKDEDKKKMTIEDLISRFTSSAIADELPDTMLLNK